MTLSRRDFLSAAGAGAVGALVGSGWGPHRPPTRSRTWTTRSRPTPTASGNRCTATSTPTTMSTGRSVTPTVRSRVR
ncbi:twin-arginine translocation signal domain-containing protein [Haloarcula pelagica]|uniref:twin-arginine translocation signal domain-containing protein n=1 Tax=Halomicroarcula sp. GCM10025709 TaxID=3252669 RepID=UPI0036D3F14C